MISTRDTSALWLLLMMPMLAATIAIYVVNQEINIFLWAPPLALISLLVMSVPFRRPCQIDFSGQTRTMQLHYLVGNSRVHQFNELESIGSCIRTGADNDVSVALVICLKNGERITVRQETGTWAGCSGWNEPERLTALRWQIASLTGIKDLGVR